MVPVEFAIGKRSFDSSPYRTRNGNLSTNNKNSGRLELNLDCIDDTLEIISAPTEISIRPKRRGIEEW